MLNLIQLYFMSKAYSIQRSKILSSNGGVGSTMETIDNISLQILPFNRWNLYSQIGRGSQRHLLFGESRLLARLRSLGFDSLNQFFQLDDFSDVENIYRLDNGQKLRVVNSDLFPRWLYCPGCGRFMDIADWRRVWNAKFTDRQLDSVPRCPYEANRSDRKIMAKNKLVQVRFVLVSMETGNIRDIPWKEVFYMKANARYLGIWEMDSTTQSCDEVFYHFKGGSELHRIGVKNQSKEFISLAEIMGHWFVIEEGGQKVAYRPIVRTSNNVYYSYNLNSVYIPKIEINNDIVDDIRVYHCEDGWSVDRIKREFDRHRRPLTKLEIQSIIDNGFQVPNGFSYATEEDFRLDEFEYLTDLARYRDGVYREDERLTSIHYPYNQHRIVNIFYQKQLCVTTVQVAYSRIDKIGLSNLGNWEGRNDPPKKWLDVNKYSESEGVNVKLRPICENFNQVSYMPALQSFGEGFLVELDLSDIAEADREVYLHTFCHILMKELEFSCGYPLASLCERLYFLPTKNKYGFMIYAVGGSTGSYGGITSLFYSEKINDIIDRAIQRAKDCPNDPICEAEYGHCFACVDIPETACEQFNTKLSRNVFNKIIV